MGPIKEALTFDDVILAPDYSDILPSEVDTKTVLSKNLTLEIPLNNSNNIMSFDLTITQSLYLLIGSELFS